MTTATRSSWETISGLLEDYTLTVEEAWFGPNEESDFDAEKPFLWLRGSAVEEDGTEHEEHTDRYSLGSNWEAVDEGAGVENAAGRTQFNSNTGIGWLVRTLVGLSEDVATTLAKRGEAYEAKTYKGLVLVQHRGVIDTFKDDDGNDRTWELPLPSAVEFPKARKSSAKSSSAKSSGSRRRKAKSKGPSLTDEITEFAKEFEADEHDEFVDQVLDPDTFDRADEIEADEEIKSDLLDEDGDIWTAAH